LENLNRFGNYLFFLLWSGMLLYMAHNAASNGNWFFVVWCAVIAGIPVYGMITLVMRSRAMRRFAAEYQLTYLGDSLPKGLLLARTSFAQKAYDYSHCVSGQLGQLSLAAFNVSYRRGKGSRSQTVVAFPRNAQISEAPVDGVGSYEFEDAGDWIIGYIPGRSVPTDELHDWCIELHTLARDLLAEANGEAEPSPHLFRWMT
jgi:hypothetical protein